MNVKKIVMFLSVLPLFAVFVSNSFATGAIAVDDAVGEKEPGYGLVVGFPDKASAKAAALLKCKAMGNEDCKVEVWFENCGAYASSKNHSGIGYGSTLQKAETKALQECGSENCKIQVSECE